MKQQIVVLLVPFEEDDGVPETWEWDDVGTLLLAGLVEPEGSPVIIDAGGGAVWKVEP